MDFLVGRRVQVNKDLKDYAGQQGVIAAVVASGDGGRPELFVLFDSGQLQFIDYRQLTVVGSITKGVRHGS